MKFAYDCCFVDERTFEGERLDSIRKNNFLFSNITSQTSHKSRISQINISTGSTNSIHFSIQIPVSGESRKG